MKGRYNIMKIVIINDNGTTETIRCRKIETAPLARRTSIFVDEERVIPLDSILVITDS